MVNGATLSWEHNDVSTNCDNSSTTCGTSCICLDTVTQEHGHVIHTHTVCVHYVRVLCMSNVHGT